MATSILKLGAKLEWPVSHPGCFIVPESVPNRIGLGSWEVPKIFETLPERYKYLSLPNTDSPGVQPIAQLLC
jgi:hypothetical protein